MTDQEIIQKYIERSEEAISLTRDKYGRLCHSVAASILSSAQDVEECVSDTYFRAWNIIPPQIPEVLSAFLCRITRNLSLDRYRANHSEKRGRNQIDLVLEELGECLTDGMAMEEQIVDQSVLKDILTRFLGSLGTDDRKVFVNRYFYMLSIKEIAGKYHVSQSKVKMSLFRSREKLKNLLEKEGFEI